MNKELDELVRTNLLLIHSEMLQQENLAGHYGGDGLSFHEEMQQIAEYIHDAGEYGIAYESIVVNAEEVPFILSSKAAVKLLEVGLIMGFKTDRPEDVRYKALTQ